MADKRSLLNSNYSTTKQSAKLVYSTYSFLLCVLFDLLPKMYFIHLLFFSYNTNAFYKSLHLLCFLSPCHLFPFYHMLNHYNLYQAPFPKIAHYSLKFSKSSLPEVLIKILWDRHNKYCYSFVNEKSQCHLYYKFLLQICLITFNFNNFLSFPPYLISPVHSIVHTSLLLGLLLSHSSPCSLLFSKYSTVLSKSLRVLQIP